MNKFVLSCLIFIGLAACNQTPVQPPLTDGPLVGGRIGGPFILTDQNGKRRSYEEFKGKFLMIYFGYTMCPDICSPDMQQLMSGLLQFERANPELGAKVQPIFISFDPKHDKPSKLKQFVNAFHPRLIGLTGSQAEIDAVVTSFAIEVTETELSRLGSPNFSHKPTPFLMDTDGKPVAFLPFDEANTEANEGSAELVAAELAKWVR